LYLFAFEKEEKKITNNDECVSLYSLLSLLICEEDKETCVSQFLSQLFLFFLSHSLFFYFSFSRLSV